MIAILLPLLVAGVIFLIGESLRRHHRGRNELARKLVHTLHGLVVIAWFLWVSPTFVAGFEVAFFALMFVIRAVAKRYPKLAWLHDVERVSWGEFYYPLGVLLALILADKNEIFIAAILELCVADALAALIGQKWGRRNRYKLFGQIKSLTGTITFLIVSVIIAATVILPHATLGLGGIIWVVLMVPLLLTVVENVSSRGSDNLTLPLLCVLLLDIRL